MEEFRKRVKSIPNPGSADHRDVLAVSPLQWEYLERKQGAAFRLAPHKRGYTGYGP